ncbi:uncharacterized protein LOC131222479 isoform X3 [Magnolia sinica]|uniref:uncharacterized protein LOC131222479 isoform X3 n=1 Tax=Magnolia sinica TaxID=86752 RepID=UPI002658992B|nr:uncharacterized protein LOC131222479 isoform X3 [Magnolia sinica]
MDLRSLNLASPVRFCSSARIQLFFSPPKPNSKSSLRPFKTSIFPLSSLSPHLTHHSSPERGDVSSWSNDVAGSVLREKLLQVVLVSPQIPGNTGCIARTCAASAIGLHLVEPLGFQVDDTKLKRAGLDYWPLETRPSIWMLKQSQAISSSSNCYQFDSKPEHTVILYVVVKVHGSWTEFREYFRQKEGEKRLLAFTKRGTAIHSLFLQAI